MKRSEIQPTGGSVSCREHRNEKEHLQAEKGTNERIGDFDRPALSFQWIGIIDRRRFLITFPAVTHRPTAEKFLRTAVKAGLRLQQDASTGTNEGSRAAGVRTLQRIKASLRKRNLNRKQLCD